jgi:hypothetical protein
MSSVEERSTAVKERRAHLGGSASRSGNAGGRSVVAPGGGQGRATIRDVAALAGVSTAAVSYVLNNRLDQVSPATRQRIEEAVQSLA